MIRDHHVVVGAAVPGERSSRSLEERLDTEVLPCLERPGRQVGPFDPRIGAPDGPSTLVLVWPSQAEGLTVPAALEPVLAKLPTDPRLPVQLACAPAADLESALRERGLPCFSRPDWWPMPAHRVWLVWLDRPLQIFGLLTLLDLAGLPRRVGDSAERPRVVVAGPGAARCGNWLSVFADLVLDDADVSTSDLTALGGDGESGTEIADLMRRGRTPQASQPRAAIVLGLSGETMSPLLEDGEHRPIGPADLGLPLWQTTVGPNGTPRTRVRVWSASRRLRETLGIEDASWQKAVREALEPEAGQVDFDLAFGLPGETAEDRIAAAGFAEEVVAAAPRGAKQVRIRIAAYAPGAGEPSSPISAEEFTGSIEAVLERCRARKLKWRVAPAGLAESTARLMRTGPELAPVIEALHLAGVRAGEVASATDASLWRRACELHDIPSDRCDPAPPGEPAPLGFDRRDLAPSRPKAQAPRAKGRRKGRPRSDRWTRWRGLVPQQFDYRIEYSKSGRLRFLGPGETTDLLLRACRRAELPLATSGVVQPRPKVSFGPSLPVGIEGAHEYVDLGLTRKVPDLLPRLRQQLPEGLEPLSCCFVPALGQRLALSRVGIAEYETRLRPTDFTDSTSWSESHERVLRWQQKLLAGLTCGDDATDPLQQLRSIECDVDSADISTLRFTLDLRQPGSRCKPREVLERVTHGLVSDVRCLPFRRTRLLAHVEEGGHAHWRTPLQQIHDVQRQVRARTKLCA